ncbi:cysteine proteinase inhibitor 5-like protein [Tanacetum coccineum]
MAARLATTMFNSLKGRPIQGRLCWLCGEQLSMDATDRQLSLGFVGKPVAYEKLKKRFKTYVNDKNSAVFPVDIIKVVRLVRNNEEGMICYCCMEFATSGENSGLYQLKLSKSRFRICEVDIGKKLVVVLVEYCLNSSGVIDRRAKESLKYENVVSGEGKVEAGVKFNLTINAADSTVENNYQAIVWDKPSHISRELISFTGPI